MPDLCFKTIIVSLLHGNESQGAVVGCVARVDAGKTDYYRNPAKMMWLGSGELGVGQKQSGSEYTEEAEPVGFVEEQVWRGAPGALLRTG